MTTVYHDFSALTGLVEAYQRAPELWREMMTETMQKSTELVDETMKTYPAQEHLERRAVYGTPFKTPLQQRWFFVSLTKNPHMFPYYRTEALANSWHRSVEVTGNGVTGRNWTNLPYAKYAQDAEMQSKMLPNWETLQGVDERLKMEINVLFFDAGNEFWHRLWSGAGK